MNKKKKEEKEEEERQNNFYSKKKKVRRTVRIHRSSSTFKSGQNRRFTFYLTFHPSILENEATCADAQHAVVANLKGGRE